MSFRRVAFAMLALASVALGAGSCDSTCASGKCANLPGTGAAGGDGGYPAGAGGAGAASCPPPTASTCVAPAPSYAAAITPILDRSCNTAACHAPGNPTGQWPLDNYTDVNDWATLITSDLLDCSMPPAGSGTPFPESDRQLIFAWLACSAPNN